MMRKSANLEFAIIGNCTSAALVNVGLFSEDIETDTGRLTGNFPQGYSHLAFIQTIFLLETQYDWSDAAKSGLSVFKGPD